MRQTQDDDTQSQDKDAKSAHTPKQATTSTLPDKELDGTQILSSLDDAPRQPGSLPTNTATGTPNSLLDMQETQACQELSPLIDGSDVRTARLHEHRATQRFKSLLTAINDARRTESDHTDHTAQLLSDGPSHRVQHRVSPVQSFECFQQQQPSNYTKYNFSPIPQPLFPSVPSAATFPNQPNFNNSGQSQTNNSGKNNSSNYSNYSNKFLRDDTLH